MLCLSFPPLTRLSVRYETLRTSAQHYDASQADAVRNGFAISSLANGVESACGSKSKPGEVTEVSSCGGMIPGIDPLPMSARAAKTWGLRSS